MVRVYKRGLFTISQLKVILRTSYRRSGIRFHASCYIIPLIFGAGGATKLKRQQNKTATKNMKKVLLTITVAALAFVACDNRPNTTYMGTQTSATPSTSGESSQSTVVTSSGYSPDPNYHPTVSSTGKYHTIDGKARQEQFQGSQEQAEQLEMIRKAELEEMMSDYGFDY